MTEARGHQKQNTELILNYRVSHGGADIKLYETTYRKRLEHRIMKPDLEKMYGLKMELFNLRLEVTTKVKSDNWVEAALFEVIKSLKKNKSSDSHL